MSMRCMMGMLNFSLSTSSVAQEVDDRMGSTPTISLLDLYEYLDDELDDVFIDMPAGVFDQVPDAVVHPVIYWSI
jgi:hypothetical protein